MHSFPKFILVGAVAVTLAGCDDTFDPFRESDVLYSVYGHLDVAADTQRIRVSPMQRPLYTVSPDPIDAAVIVEEVESGRVIQFQRELVSRPAANFDQTLYATNFISTEVIRPHLTYRVSIRRSDGTEASAVVRTPANFRDSTVVVQFKEERTNPFQRRTQWIVRFHAEEGDHLAMFHFVRYPPDAVGDATSASPSTYCRERYAPIVISPLLEPKPIASVGAGAVEIWEIDTGRGPLILPPARPDDPWQPKGGYPPPCEGIGFEQDIRIVRSRDPWEVDDETIGMTIHAHSNVQNGTGFIGAATTRVFPADACFLVGPGAGEFCDLYYGPQSATLIVVSEGKVDDENESITLRRDMESWSRTGNRYPIWNNGSKNVRYRGLLPGSYRVGLENMDICEVTLAPGEEKTITLQRGPVQPGAPLDPSRCVGV